MDEASDILLIEKRLQLVLSTLQKQWDQKFRLMEEKVTQLQQVVTRPQPTPRPVQQASAPTMQIQQPQMQIQQPQPRMQAPQQQVPRNAVGPREYENPEEISIEKYFYFGNKG